MPDRRSRASTVHLYVAEHDTPPSEGREWFQAMPAHRETGRRPARQARRSRGGSYHLIAFALRAERLKRSGEHGMRVLG